MTSELCRVCTGLSAPASWIQVLSHSVVCNSPTPWTAAFQAPLALGLSRQDTGVGGHALLRGIFPTQGSKPASLTSPALTGGVLTTEPPGKPLHSGDKLKYRMIGLQSGAQPGACPHGPSYHQKHVTRGKPQCMSCYLRRKWDKRGFPLQDKHLHEWTWVRNEGDWQRTPEELDHAQGTHSLSFL